MSAPKKPKDQFKGCYVVARMTDAQHRKVVQAAKKAKMPVAEYVRVALFQHIDAGKDKQQGVAP